MSLSIVFLGAKPIGYHCLQYLIKQQKELGNFHIKGVITQSRQEFNNQYDVLELAKKNKLPIFFSLDELPECDWLISVQYHEILKTKQIQKAKKMAINLHLAPLPEYRGCNQFSFAIFNQASTFGVTIHKMDNRIDHGDILFEKRFPIPKNCWVDELYKLSEKNAQELFAEALPHIISGKYTAQSQTDLIAKRGSRLYYRKDIEQLKCIDLQQNQETIERQIRATSMPGFSPPYCIIDGKKIYFKKR